ncbi:MAG: sulfite exporter TauE/SafE family protein [Clostridia bacterium]|nr:sulfite exporter TauE/SafE family protein [Clostridia bacterium]
MEFVWYVIAGITGGVLGGMGMGGGTVLIPLLSIFYAVSQHTAQAVNLISFIPMAVVAIIIHLKNKMIKFDKVLYTIIPGVVFCIAGCFLAKAMSGELLKRFFGGFLLILSVFQFVVEIKKKS